MFETEWTPCSSTNIGGLDDGMGSIGALNSIAHATADGRLFRNSPIADAFCNKEYVIRVGPRAEVAAIGLTQLQCSKRLGAAGIMRNVGGSSNVLWSAGVKAWLGVLT